MTQPSPHALTQLLSNDAQRSQPLTAAEFERQLRANGHAYHYYHAFNVLLNSGRASPAQLRGWMANCFYCRIHMPPKDSAVDPWLRLGEAVGFTANELWSTEHVLPGVRAAVNTYVDHFQQRPWQEAVCASLTELFAMELYNTQLANWSDFYPWIDRAGLEYFRANTRLEPQAIEAGLRITQDHFRTREAQTRALELLRLKLDLLWAVLDAVEEGYRF